MTGVLLGRGEDTQILSEEEGHVTTEAEMGEMPLRAKAQQGFLGATRSRKR